MCRISDFSSSNIWIDVSTCIEMIGLQWPDYKGCPYTVLSRYFTIHPLLVIWLTPSHHSTRQITSCMFARTRVWVIKKCETKNYNGTNIMGSKTFETVCS